VPHLFRRHAESKQPMGFRRFMFRGVTKCATNGTSPAPPWTGAGCGRWASRRPSPRAAR